MRSLYNSEQAAIRQRAAGSAPYRISPANIAPLPAPVRRYLEESGRLGKPGIRNAILRQTGSIRAGAEAPWMPFMSEQFYCFGERAFLWLARASMAPLVAVEVRDKFDGGRGNMLVKMMGIRTLADGTGPEFDQGAALRYWGEVISFPEALVDPVIRWTALGPRKAGLRVARDGMNIEGTVEFGADGLPKAFHAARFRDVDGKGVLTPWSGYLSSWKDFSGRLFPSHWESVWHLPEGDLLGVKIDVLEVTTE